MQTSLNITSLTSAKGHPFGSQEVILLVASKPRHCMQGRAFSSGSYRSDSYRHGFNNQEKDSELGDVYAFEYRIHDTRLGRFLSLDPLSPKFPFYSPFQFCSNSPIVGVDIEGLESSVSGQNISENLEILDEGKSGYPRSESDDNSSSSTSSKPSITRGEIKYSGPGIESRIKSAINPTKEVKRVNLAGCFIKTI